MPNEFRVYRPNSNKTGAASKFNLAVKKRDKYEDIMVFLETARQTGVDENKNARFDWRTPEKKNGQNVVLKLGEADIGAILDTLSGSGRICKLFHQNEKGSTTLELLQGDKGFALKVSGKQGDNPPVQIMHGISFGEAAMLKVLMEAAVLRIYGW